jgi:hypothetical protein
MKRCAMTIIVDEDGGCMMGTRLLALFGMMDYAEDWSAHPIRELHPFIPLKYGKEITEEEFRTMVKAMHRLGEDDIPG